MFFQVLSTEIFGAHVAVGILHRKVVVSNTKFYCKGVAVGVLHREVDS